MKRIAFHMLCVQAVVVAVIWVVSVSHAFVLFADFDSVSVSGAIENGHAELGWQSTPFGFSRVLIEPRTGTWSRRRPLAWYDVQPWLWGAGIDLWFLFTLSAAWPLARLAGWVRRRMA